MKRIMFIAVLVVLLTRKAISGVPPTEELTVGSAVHSIVYAEVVEVSETRQYSWGEPGWRVKLNVKCTLTGPYDAVAHPFLEVGMSQRGIDGPLRPPKPRARVVVLLRCSASLTIPIAWNIPHRAPAFMPSKSPIVEVQGFDDPKVAEIIARLRELRAAEPPRPWDTVRMAAVAEWANGQAGRMAGPHSITYIFELLERLGKTEEAKKK